jgi:hypothetical protein
MPSQHKQYLQTTIVPSAHNSVPIGPSFVGILIPESYCDYEMLIDES